MMSEFPWNQFIVLFAVGLLGSLAAMPYAFAMNRQRLGNIPIPLRRILLLSLAQYAVLGAISAALGLLFSNAIGLGAPLLERALAGEDNSAALTAQLPLAIGLGVAVAILIVLLDRFFFRSLIPPEVNQQLANVALWKRFLVCFYGGINEEILTRLFLFSTTAWVLGQIWHAPDGLPSDGAFWAANIAAALVFGLFHLPATASLTQLSPMIVVRAIVLNGIAGIVFGYLFWQYSLIAAMLAHFSADIVIHIITPVFVRSGEATVESNGRV